MGLNVLLAGCAVRDDFVVNDPGMVPYHDHGAPYVPSDPIADPETETQVSSIRQLLAAGEFDSVIARADDLISAPNARALDASALAQLFVLRGIAQYSTNRLPEAIASYSSAIEADDRCWIAYFHRWKCRILQRDFDGTLDDQRVGRRLAPPDARALFDDGGVI